jgi:hypothetical protein
MATPRLDWPQGILLAAPGVTLPPQPIPAHISHTHTTHTSHTCIRTHTSTLTHTHLHVDLSVALYARHAGASLADTDSGPLWASLLQQDQGRRQAVAAALAQPLWAALHVRLGGVLDPELN